MVFCEYPRHGYVGGAVTIDCKLSQFSDLKSLKVDRTTCFCKIFSTVDSECSIKI